MLKETISDISSLGGNPVYFGFTFLFLATNHLKEFWALTVALILAYSLTMAIRVSWWQQRPDHQKYSDFWEKFDSGSFPSLHAIRATMLASSLIIFYQNIFVAIAFSGAVAAVCFARLWLKRHRAVDVVAGVIFGLIISWLAPQIINALGIL